MKLFIDTAILDEIKEAASWGIIDGVTTNPSLIAKSGRKQTDVLKEITQIVDGPISGEVNASTKDEMIIEGRELSKIHSNIIVKIPMTKEGLQAVKVLSEEGIKTNVTLIFTATQALLAAKVGATYVSPFLGRLEDISNQGIELIKDICFILKTYGYPTQVICASIRTPIHVLECAKVGADVCTVPFKVLEQLYNHPLTTKGIEQFVKDSNGK